MHWGGSDLTHSSQCSDRRYLWSSRLYLLQQYCTLLQRACVPVAQIGTRSQHPWRKPDGSLDYPEHALKVLMLQWAQPAAHTQASPTSHIDVFHYPHRGNVMPTFMTTKNTKPWVRTGTRRSRRTEGSTAQRNVTAAAKNTQLTALARPSSSESIDYYVL